MWVWGFGLIGLRRFVGFKVDRVCGFGARAGLRGIHLGVSCLGIDGNKNCRALLRIPVLKP